MTEAKTQAVKWAEPHVKNAKTVSFLLAIYFAVIFSGILVYYCHKSLDLWVAFMFCVFMMHFLQKYIPAIKETVATHVEPHVRTLSIKAKEAYHASKSAVSPHIVTVQEIVDPYYQV